MRFETTQTEPGSTTITIAGNLIWGDRETQLLESAVKNLVHLGERKFVFDLTGLNYADSSGINKHLVSLALRRTGSFGKATLKPDGRRRQGKITAVGVLKAATMVPWVEEKRKNQSAGNLWTN